MAADLAAFVTHKQLHAGQPAVLELGNMRRSRPGELDILYVYYMRAYTSH